ncbi:DJ-1/PfpI family protein [Burkholderia sp. Ac-20353]|uniref:DJ-1/PfpI family protein n=1 Tax=Burkholderia sp. Ac-20353 TaxID=2703894 RepID=UPI00197BA4D3|nr:DJ-1/PfpI family protein [Burkholderia sp. Ac-20353]MBN3787231.1 DJ-1/PfpI family protein [Burkholderia sp. Ac-20353]
MTTQAFVVVFALFDRVTQLDFTGPDEVFCRLPGAQCRMASVHGGSIRADSGLTIANVERLADIERADLISVPGGFGVIDALGDAAFLREVRRLASGARYVTSVCSGSLVLGAAGLLHRRRAACHWAWRDLLPPFGAIVDDGRVVRDGNVITGGGVTAGIDMALTVMAEIAGPDYAQAVQLGIEYAPAPPFDCGRPERAAPHILEAVTMRFDRLRPDRHAAVERAARDLRDARHAPSTGHARADAHDGNVD